VIAGVKSVHLGKEKEKGKKVKEEKWKKVKRKEI